MKSPVLLILATLLVSCGGGGGGDGGPPPQVTTEDPPPTLTSTGVALIKFRSAGTMWAALTERLRRIEDLTAPDRTLLVSPDSKRSPVTIAPPAGWSLIDFALHPSGETTLVLATDTELRLQQRGINGELLGDSSFTDERAATDPFIGNIGTIRDSQSLVPKGTRDAAQIAPVGDDVILALRTGRNAVLAQRLRLISAGHFERLWRTVVEPGVPIDQVRLIGGTFDPFGSLDNQWHVVLDVDTQGRSAIAVSLGHTELPAGHREYFGEPIDPALITGVMLTLVDATGVRLSATAIDTAVPSEVHVVRWAGDTVVVGGRMFTTQRADGGGWDGYLARLRFGDPAARLDVLDFDRGDAILDVAALPDGRLAIAGSTAYLQNPTGGSVSEDAEPLLAVLPSSGGSAQRVPLPRGPRHNQVRTIAAWGEHRMIGGLQNGPGTHSADADPALLTCDGFLREQPL